MIEDDIKNVSTEGLHCKTYVAAGAMNIEKIEHVENLFPGNPDLIKAITGKASAKNSLLDDDALRDCINLIMHKITKNRYWFCIIKPLMLLGQVRPNDFEGAAGRIRKLYPAGLPVDIDVSDLQSMHWGSFVGPVNTWRIGDGPFKREAEFKTYFTLASEFERILKERLSF